MSSLASRLETLAAETEPLLRAIPEVAASASVAPRWSRKQELGHLVDSAANNRIRFIRAALENQYDGPSYDGEGWVELGGYSEIPWASLISLWRGLNRAMSVMLDRIPAERMAAPCRVGGAESVTLEFLIDDYIAHMRHHLDHILSAD